MPRFVILEHDHPRGRHYDFMLEMGDSLKTWAIAEPPAIGATQDAKLLPDHRPAYLDYEGPVSGDRGTVKRWDCGDYELIEEAEGSLIVEISGEKIRCRATAIKDAADPLRWQWTFCGLATDHHSN